MAIEQEYKKAQNEFAKYDVEANADGTYTVDGKRLSAREFGEAKKKAKKDLDAVSKTRSGLSNARKVIAGLQKTNQTLAKSLARGGSEATLSTTQEQIAANNARIAELETRFDFTPSAVAVAPETEMTTEQLSEAAGRGRMGVEGGFGATAPRQPKTPKAPKTPKGSGGPPKTDGNFPGDTKVSGGVTYTWNGTQWNPTGKRSIEKTIAEFKRLFPKQAWYADIDPVKYPEVRGVLQRAIDGEMWKTPQGLERFKTEWESTDFFRELTTDRQVQTITSLVGDLGFDTVPLNQFLTTSMNMGWKGETLKAEVYKEVFRKDNAGAYVNKTAFERVKKSNDYLSVAKVGKDYFSEVPESDIEMVLTGGMLTEDVQRKQRELAKTKYGHLSNLIEQGFTLAQLSDPFKQQAAQLLEKTPDAINMSEANFEAAYNYGEPGQKRMMTSGEWEIMLRSDAKYGWDKTNNAKAEARQLATSIAQAFGKVI